VNTDGERSVLIGGGGYSIADFLIWIKGQKWPGCLRYRRLSLRIDAGLKSLRFFLI
jgi:hypothetical protein